MPVATPFNALGAGNGFPLWGRFSGGTWIDDVACLPKTDVSTYDHVATMTLEQASKMFWNLAKTNGSATYVPNDGDPQETITSTNLMTGYTDFDPDFPINDGGTPLEPIERVCNRKTVTNPSHMEFGNEVAMTSIVSSTPLTGGAFNPAFVITEFARPRRYYNGDVNDEDNFIGYGFGRDGTFAQATANSWNGVATAGYASAIRDASLFFPGGTWANTVVSGIPVLRFTQTDGGEGDSSASLGDFDFYTYP